MAYIFNGYVYHTPHDRTIYVSKESLQSTGNNILALVKAIGNAPEMDDPNNRVGIETAIELKAFLVLLIFKL